MNISEIDKIAFSYIKNKLTLNLLHSMSEIYTDNIIIENTIHIRDNLFRHFINIKTVLDMPYEKRNIYINNILSDIKELESIVFPVIQTIESIDLITSIVNDIYQVKFNSLDDNTITSKDILMQNINEIISSEVKNQTFHKNGGIFLSLVDFCMTSDNYNEYLKTSLEVLFKDANKKTVDATIKSLKYKFSPLSFLDNSDEKKLLLSFTNMSYENLDEKKLLDLLTQLDEFSLLYSDKLGEIRALYNTLNEINSLYTFVIDKDYLFFDDFIDDFIIKDIFYLTIENLEKNTLNDNDNIVNMIYDKINELSKKCNDELKIIRKFVLKNKNNNLSTAIKMCVTISQFLDDNLEQSVTFKSNYDNEALSNDFLYEKINDFILFVNNLPFKTKFIKKLKQQFFFYIPCIFSESDMKVYLSNAFENLSYEKMLISSFKISVFNNNNDNDK